MNVIFIVICLYSSGLCSCATFEATAFRNRVNASIVYAYTLQRTTRTRFHDMITDFSYVSSSSYWIRRAPFNQPTSRTGAQRIVALNKLWRHTQPRFFTSFSQCHNAQCKHDSGHTSENRRQRQQELGDVPGQFTPGGEQHAAGEPATQQLRQPLPAQLLEQLPANGR